MSEEKVRLQNPGSEEKESDCYYGTEDVGGGDIESWKVGDAAAEEEGQALSRNWKAWATEAYFAVVAWSLPITNLLTLVNVGNDDTKDLRFHWIFWPILAAYIASTVNLYISSYSSADGDDFLGPSDRIMDCLTSDVGRACVLVWVVDFMLNTTVQLDFQNLFYDILYDTTALVFCYLLNYRYNQECRLRMRNMNVSHFANAALDAVFYLWVYWKQNNKAREEDDDSNYSLLVESLDLIVNLQFVYALLEFSLKKIRLPMVDLFRRPRYDLRSRKWT